MTVYCTSHPKTFFPQQDTGRCSEMFRPLNPACLQAMQARLTGVVMAIFRADPAVAGVTGFPEAAMRIDTGVTCSFR
ncbi:MAG: hypothetical protein IPM88_20950 [Nitrospira sp.]|nr:hypothetical protein [Nitrospira sp.]